MRRTSLGRTGKWGLLAVLVLVVGCGEREAPPHGEDPADPVEAPTPDPERLPSDDPAHPEAPPRVPDPAVASAELEEALFDLVRGPTDEERAGGDWSWFSVETAGVLRSVEVSRGGDAVVDFHDLRALIPGASSSAGSEALLDELNEAVFRLPWIQSVEYRMEGSCSEFWEWLQYDCRTVSRPGGGP